MSKEQEERIFEMGGKSHDQVLDEQIGVKGSPERIKYEQDCKREFEKRWKAIEAKEQNKICSTPIQNG